MSMQPNIATQPALELRPTHLLLTEYPGPTTAPTPEDFALMLALLTRELDACRTEARRDSLLRVLGVAAELAVRSWR